MCLSAAASFKRTTRVARSHAPFLKARPSRGEGASWRVPQAPWSSSVYIDRGFVAARDQTSPRELQHRSCSRISRKYCQADESTETPCSSVHTRAVSPTKRQGLAILPRLALDSSSTRLRQYGTGIDALTASIASGLVLAGATTLHECT